MANICDSTNEKSPVCNKDRSPRMGSGRTMTIHICPTTGGQFELQVPLTETVDGLKGTVAKKLKVQRERISLLYRDRLLKEGLLSQNQLEDHCRLTLLPNVESGLLSQKPEQANVLQALDSLSENQVNDFLSGKAPLTLAMRLSDHMVFMQLQLSTSPAGCKRVSPGPTRQAPASSRNTRAASKASPAHGRVPVRAASKASPAHTGHARVPVVLPHTFGHSSSSSGQKPSFTPRFNSASQLANHGGRPHKGPHVPVLDRRTLAEASRNLSQKLKELTQYTPTPSTESTPEVNKRPVWTACNSSKCSSSSSSSASSTGGSSGAYNGPVIESMQNHGGGVYSGTFSGTLNPALQDKDGRLKRNTSTIIHILNDLLGATPQYSHQLGHQRDQKDRIHHRFHANREEWRTSQENQVTRGKMEHLQMMLEERRQKRQARRMGRSRPYPAWSGLQKQRNSSDDMDVDHSILDNSTVPENVSEKEGGLSELTQETIVA